MLVRLHRLTGDCVHIACARRYADLFLRRDLLYLCVECHKYLWSHMTSRMYGCSDMPAACGRARMASNRRLWRASVLVTIPAR